MSPALLLLAAIPAAPPPVADIKLPPGFVARLASDHTVAPNIYTMTIDDAGRVLVAGPGYVRVLVDADGDGVAEGATDLIDGLKEGPMGLFAEGESLYVVVEGGLRRYRGYNGKDKLKTPPETLLRVKTSGEHDAHAVRRGPDGWLYLLCGNMAGVTKATITSPRSPVKEPVAGTLVRVSPDDKLVEVVADGLRNAYGFDFNLDGEPFTYDSDNERCVGLPWYEPCRFYHVVPGGNYGWRSPQLGQFWRKPPYFIDCVPPVCYLGRGSPTGVACYRHTHFPEKYCGGFLLADWTFGRIHFVPLTPRHSSYEGTPEVFAEAVGTSGFAPTALAVHPKTGELFVSIGGRGTRGGVYRISHDKSPAGKKLEVAKRSLEWTDLDAKKWLGDCTGDDALLRRVTLERMARAGLKFPWTPKLQDGVKPNLSHSDPLIRMAAARTVKPMTVPLGSVLTPEAQLMQALVLVREEPDESLKLALTVLADKEGPDGLKLRAIRIVQLACGDLTSAKAVGTAFEGYTFRNPVPEATAARIEATCIDMAWGNKILLRREVLRTLAALGSGKREPFIAAVQEIDERSDVSDDLHHLLTLARFTYYRSRSKEEAIAKALLNLEQKATAQKTPRDTFWPLRVAETAAGMLGHHEWLGFEMLALPEFGRPEHLLFVKPLQIPVERAATQFLAVAATNPDFNWTPGLVGLIEELPDNILLPILTRLWEKPELQEAIVKVLAKRPRAADEAKFLKGLGSFDPEVVRLSASALSTLSTSDWQAELTAAVKALRRLAPEDKAARAALAALLSNRTDHKLPGDAKAWTDWLSKEHPSMAAVLNATNDGFDAAAWKKREAGIAWDKGDAERGRAVFAKASCAACHDGGRALGPSLLGITKRFGRNDLLTAILQPGRDISPRYRPTRVTTTDEKVYIGMLVYEATDGVILQTAVDTSVRVAGADIASKRPVDSSIMPAGLLDKLTDTEVADLLAYLKTLEEPKSK